MDNINKIWGKRLRIHLDAQHETDLVHLKKDTFCSTHDHKYKSNKFVVVSGKVKIETEYGNTILFPNDSWTVNAPLKHRFVALENSIMIEMAFVEEGEIDPSDINRISLGGRIIDGEEYPIDILKQKGMLDL